MRDHIRRPGPFQKSLPAASVPELPRQRPPSDAKLVRFPCGHTDGEARVAGAIRERKTSIWVCCPRCNVIALAIAEIEMR